MVAMRYILAMGFCLSGLIFLNNVLLLGSLSSVLALSTLPYLEIKRVLEMLPLRLKFLLLGVWIMESA
jgi:hypothetical protein